MSILLLAVRVYRALQTECKQSGNPPAAFSDKDRYRQTFPADFHRSCRLLEKRSIASPEVQMILGVRIGDQDES